MDASERKQRLEQPAVRDEELIGAGAKTHEELYDASVATLGRMNPTEACIVANAALFVLAREADEDMLPATKQWKELMVSIAWAISTIDPLVNGDIAEAVPSQARLRLCEPGETLSAASGGSPRAGS